MSFAPIKLVAQTDLSTWPTDLPTEFPAFEEDMPEPAEQHTFEERCERQALEQKEWDGDKIGSMPKDELFYAGLNPIDFLRAFHDKHDNMEKIDELISLDADTDTSRLFYAKMGLHHQHINNQFSDAELENLCYERPGSKRWYYERLTDKLGCKPSEIPLEVVDAIQECNIQKSLGRTSFRNFMRRVNKRYEKKTGKTKKGKKTKKWTLKTEPTVLNFN